MGPVYIPAWGLSAMKWEIIHILHSHKVRPWTFRSHRKPATFCNQLLEVFGRENLSEALNRAESARSSNGKTRNGQENEQRWKEKWSIIALLCYFTERCFRLWLKQIMAIPLFYCGVRWAWLGRYKPKNLWRFLSPHWQQMQATQCTPLSTQEGWAGASEVFA